MPKLLDPKTVLYFFELDPDKKSATLSPQAINNWLMREYQNFIESLRKWAEEKYPNVPPLYHCCFACLIIYFATGAYGGYGTEKVQKERFAELKTYEYYESLHDFHDMFSPEQMTTVLINFIISHLLQKSPLENEVREKIDKSIELLKASKNSFRSKEVAEARRILEGI